MTTTNWGAHASDWEHFAVGLDLTADLLPVVSNPTAAIADNSKLKQLGKTPSLLNNDHKVVGIPRWTDKVSTGRDVLRWSGEPDYGICIQTRRVRALDVDIPDPVLAQEVQDIIEEELDLYGITLPRRVREGSGKFLCPLILPGGYHKRILKTEGGAIEFLANGQQFVAIGTHPSGTRYEWEGGLPEEIPEIPGDLFELLWSRLVKEFGIEAVVEYGESRGTLVPRQARDVDDDLVGYLFEHGWVKSSNSDGRLNVRCPFEAEHSGPSADDTATQYLPAGLGGYAQGHFKCLHAHCAGRNDGDFLAKVGFIAADFDVVPPAPAGSIEPPPFTRSREGKILATLPNVTLAMRSAEWLGVTVAYDEFRDEMMIAPAGTTAWESFTDADYTRLRLQLAGRGLEMVGAEMIRDVTMLVAHENAFDSAKLWLEGEVPAWDGVPRIEAFYARVFGCDDTAYVRAAGLYTWTAMAGRVLDPGCKADMVPVLVGQQGIGKSQVVAAMAPSHEFFVELDLGQRDDDMSRLMRGRLIAELGELRGLHSREAESIKAFITRRHENWVPKYREFATTFPRRLIFIGTSNRAEFLADDTGNRRWLPLTARRADVDYVEAHRSQLWAEARERWRKDGILYAGAETLARGEHDEYRLRDSWETVVGDWLDSQFADLDGEGGGEVFHTTHDILVGALKLEPRAMARRDEMRLGTTMTALGWERVRRMEGGIRVYGWVQKTAS